MEDDRTRNAAAHLSEDRLNALSREAFVVDEIESNHLKNCEPCRIPTQTLCPRTLRAFSWTKVKVSEET